MRKYKYASIAMLLVVFLTLDAQDLIALKLHKLHNGKFICKECGAIQEHSEILKTLDMYVPNDEDWFKNNIVGSNSRHSDRSTLRDLASEMCGMVSNGVLRYKDHRIEYQIQKTKIPLSRYGASWKMRYKTNGEYFWKTTKFVLTPEVPIIPLIENDVAHWIEWDMDNKSMRSYIVTYDFVSGAAKSKTLLPGP
jgi:hypothetical protein